LLVGTLFLADEESTNSPVQLVFLPSMSFRSSTACEQFFFIDTLSCFCHILSNQKQGLSFILFRLEAYMPNPLLANEPRFFFNITGTEVMVSAFKAREQISSPFEVDLELACEEEIYPEKVIGQPAILTVAGFDTTRYFHGIVNQIIQTGIVGRFFKYQIRIVPNIWRLSLEKDCRIFQDKSIPDIVKEVFQESGITSDWYEFRLQGTYEPRDYCVQYRETDLDFISRLLEEEGIFYFFEHTEDKHLMILGDGTVNYQPIADKDDVIFNPVGSMVEKEEALYRFLLSRVMCSGKIYLAGL
jgi:type VI secretion system secreted protein VgrG